MKKCIILIIITSLLTTSCATIFTGTKDRIWFKTNPAGATIYINGIEQCKTPCSTNVKRKVGDTDVEIKLDSYETRIIQLDKEFNIVSVINLGNLLGWAIDAASGALMKYDRRAYDLDLTKDKKTSSILPSKVEIDTNNKIATVYTQTK